ncbi:MAG TPA: hypothetical protein VI322_00155 [Candidatus Saccharimonadia bacterium]
MPPTATACSKAAWKKAYRTPTTCWRSWFKSNSFYARDSASKRPAGGRFALDKACPSPSKGFIAYGSDALPWLSASLTGQADYGFTVDWLANGTFDPKNDFRFTFNTGTQCRSPHAQNCHTLQLDATSIAQLVIDQTNNSRSQFAGLATLSLDGVATTNPFTVTGLDGDRLTPAQNDTFALAVYAPGADPAQAAPLYHGNVALDKGNAVKVQ